MGNGDKKSNEPKKVQPQQQQITLEQYLNNARAMIIMSSENFKDQAVKSLEDLGRRLAEQAQLNETLMKTITDLRQKYETPKKGDKKSKGK